LAKPAWLRCTCRPRLGQRRAVHGTVVEIGLSVRNRRAEISLLAREFLVQIAEQFVEAVDVAKLEIASQPFTEHLHVRMQIAAAVAPIDSLLKGKIAGLAQKTGHDRRFGATISDHDQRCGLEQRQQYADQLPIEICDLFGQVLVSVLFGLAVQPHDLSAIEDVELSKIVRTTIHFSHVPDVGPFVIERPR